MGPIGSLVFLILVCGAFLIVRGYIKHSREQDLRSNPPERATIEVSLPNGIKDANRRMQKIARKLEFATQADSKDRRAGKGQLEFLYLFEFPDGANMPSMRFLVQCDNDKMDTAKRVIKQGFDGNASVQSVDNTVIDDAFAELAAAEHSEEVEHETQT